MTVKWSQKVMHLWLASWLCLIGCSLPLLHDCGIGAYACGHAHDGQTGVEACTDHCNHYYKDQILFSYTFDSALAPNAAKARVCPACFYLSQCKTLDNLHFPLPSHACTSSPWRTAKKHTPRIYLWWLISIISRGPPPAHWEISPV